MSTTNTSVVSRVFSRFRKIAFYLQGGTRYAPKQYDAVLTNALGNYNPCSDISDHLGVIYFFTTIQAPKLIVELGTRGGESTRALLAASTYTNATMLSVDIDDCKAINIPNVDRWNFVQADDVAYATKGFPEWCIEKKLKPVIDVLFIDTSHLYEHTVQEIAAWTPYLAEEGVIIFHDTNMGAGIYGRLDRTMGVGWDNDRGVIRAVEEFVGRKYDEASFFSDVTDDYSVLHFPNCSGLTVLKRRRLMA